MFVLSEYQCDRPDEPAWRVTHAASQTVLDPATGDLVAADTEYAIFSKNGLRGAAGSHFNTHSTRPSCFVSVFLNEERARAWAKGRGHPDKVRITKINLTLLPVDAYIFDAIGLGEGLGLYSRSLDDELIVLHRIPRRCLVETRSLSEIYEDDTLKFPVITSESIHDILVHVKDLEETTNPATQRKNSTVRYFKGCLEFAVRNHDKKRLIRVPDVQIAFHDPETTASTYGQDYIYAVFPKEVRDLVVAAVRYHPNLNPDEEKFVTSKEPGKWWRTVAIRHCIFEHAAGPEDGSSSRENAPFDPRSTFEETRQGFTAELVLGISIKAQMEEADGYGFLSESEARTVEIEAYRAVVSQDGVDVGPIPFKRTGNKEVIAIGPSLVASPEFVRRFENLFIHVDK
ncbi:hypothetical protein N658DRAFT_459620 [Parathielavia hyrcaniae]|uniref:DUF7587 domain-containing protein n=1 Tax=Parathielavia hyrcaniae TaxID=113614 RepID=A0AAN6PQK5_9PEZI|nr:hypothetical protein N658DRAFT_459620 [Parathielavia hyrcaniae]